MESRPESIWGRTRGTVLRPRHVDDVVEVEVLKVGTQRPLRVLVTFVDESFEGRQEWVPPARLKVLWESVDGFRDNEAHWNRMAELGRGFDDPADATASEVFDALIARDVARMEYREAGACRITHLERLSELTGLDCAVWAQCPDGFTDGDDLVVPWPITEQIAAAAARCNPAPILEAVQREETESRHRAIHGQRYRGRGSTPDSAIPPEICIKVDNELVKPRLTILRGWCGVAAVDRFDELVELRKEIHRIGQIAESANNALRTAGRRQDADELTRQLGMPVEMLRRNT